MILKYQIIESPSLEDQVGFKPGHPLDYWTKEQKLFSVTKMVFSDGNLGRNWFLGWKLVF